MSGYLLAFSKLNNMEMNYHSFQRVFSCNNAAVLNSALQTVNDRLCFIPWSYGEAKNWPDLFWTEIGKYHLFVDGYITIPIEWREWLAEWQRNPSLAVKILNGSFSLAIYDKDQSTISIVTDRFNSRPVFYAQQNSRLVIGNFQLAVAAFHGEYSIDPAGLWALMMTSRPVGYKTIFKEVRAIPAGTIQSFSEAKCSLTKWFSLQYNPNHSRSKETYARIVADALNNSALRIKQTCDDLVLYLSGGLDSRIAAAALGPINTVTLISNQNMSSRIAQSVAQKTGARHELIVRDNNWYLDYFSLNSLLAGGSYNITHGHFTRHMLNSQKEESARAYVLGDLLENFNKNYYRIDECRYSFKPEVVPDQYYRAYAFASKHIENFRQIFNDQGRSFEEAWREELKQMAREINLVSDNPGDKWNALFRWYNNTWCPTNFMLESIKPFAKLRNLMFDNELFELLLNMPDAYRDGNMHSRVLKYLNPSLLNIPNSNFGLPPFLPKIFMIGAKKIRPWLGRMMRNSQKQNSFKTHGSWHMLNMRYCEELQHRVFVNRVLSSKFYVQPPFGAYPVVNIWKEFVERQNEMFYEINMLLSFGLLFESFDKRSA